MCCPFKLLFTLVAVIALSRAWVPETTEGEVWPLLQNISSRSLQLAIDPSHFEFKITNQTCDIVQQAVKRYIDVIKKTSPCSRVRYCKTCAAGQDTLRSVDVHLDNPCEQLPHLDMDETYEIHINTPGIYEKRGVILSSSVWGILRGLETFSQLVIPSPDPSCSSLVVNSTDILDYPRFKHRGLLLDTSRHYLPVSVITNILSAMEMNKMNVLHWHIVDDQSFPYQSYSFPSLSEKGAYDPKRFIYTQEDVKNIIEYATLRGIRVIPEFDTPGHTQSWGKGVSKLLTPCYINQTLNGDFGPIDPSRNENYKFIKTLFQEVKQTFPDNYIHVGGDEVEYTCWESNPAINKFMKEHNISDYEGLEGYYIKEVLNIMNNIKAKGIVWQEVFIHNASLRPDTIVHIWTGDRADLLDQVTSKGNLALLSQGWYLDHINDLWQDFYNVDPSDFNGTTAQKQLVLGGEACMWGEMVDETNVVPRIWPRASATAERLWSSFEDGSSNNAAPRLNEHVCRMKRRGIAAQPANGPGFCLY